MVFEPIKFYSRSSDSPVSPTHSASPPPIPQFVVPPSLLQQVDGLRSQLTKVQLENQRLEYQLRSHEMREQAYQSVFTLNKNRTYTLGSYGQIRELVDRAIDHAVHVDPAPLLRQKPFFIIWFFQQPDPLVLDECTFYHDVRLLTAFAEFGLTVHSQRSVKSTAHLLRTAIGQHLKRLPLDAYAGWLAPSSGPPTFATFSNGRTCQDPNHLELSLESLPSMPTAATAVAASRFLPALKGFSDRNYRMVLLL